MAAATWSVIAGGQGLKHVVAPHVAAVVLVVQATAAGVPAPATPSAAPVPSGGASPLARTAPVTAASAVASPRATVTPAADAAAASTSTASSTTTAAARSSAPPASAAAATVGIGIVYAPAIATAGLLPRAAGSATPATSVSMGDAARPIAIPTASPARTGAPVIVLEEAALGLGRQV